MICLPLSVTMKLTGARPRYDDSGWAAVTEHAEDVVGWGRQPSDTSHPGCMDPSLGECLIHAGAKNSIDYAKAGSLA